MSLWGNLLSRVEPGYETPGSEGVCRSCEHTPTKRYRRSWLDVVLRKAKSVHKCTARDDAENASGYPEPCLCTDSYHYRHFKA